MKRACYGESLLRCTGSNQLRLQGAALACPAPWGESRLRSASVWKSASQSLWAFEIMITLRSSGLKLTPDRY